MRNTPRFAALTLILTLAFVPSASATPPSPLDEANTALIRASHAGRMMLGLLDDARRRRNVRDTQCVDRALSQINSFTQNLEQRRNRLRDALARGNDSEAAHQRRVIQTVLSQVHDRQAAGRACLYGEVASGHSVTVVEVIVDREVPRHADLSAEAANRNRRW